MTWSEFTFSGCRLGPAQTWGSVRMAPITRDRLAGDLRLAGRPHELSSVRSSLPGATFTKYMPSGMVVRWSRDGSVVATGETHLAGQGTYSAGQLWKRKAPDELFFLPNALAIEGFMIRHFRGPDIAWLDYQCEVRRGSLGYRIERGVPGWFLKGLDEALSLFERSPDQVGTALFLDEELIGCFICPHPEDYAKLHESLLLDSFPDYLIHYGYLRYAKGGKLHLRHESIDDLAGLRSEFARAKAEVEREEAVRLSALAGRQVESEVVYRTETFHLERFVTELEKGGDNFAGEAIRRTDGTLEYLKLFRLNRGQTRRLYLLSTLARASWNFEAAARVLGFHSKDEVASALIEAELGYLLNPSLYAHLMP